MPKYVAYAVRPQLTKNLFEVPYAHTLLAFSGSPSSPGQAVGMALYFFNFSTWTGRPGIYVRMGTRVNQIRVACHIGSKLTG